jgi:hypothetical protein
VRNAFGKVTSHPATLTVLLQPPDLTSDPLDQSVLSGADASFSVTAVGSLPLSYQWQRNGVDLSDNERISGSQTATLRIMGAAVQDLGLYGVTVRNSYGWTVSFPAQLTVALAPPTITREPQGSKVALGSTVSLQVQATGSLPLTYQWQRDGVNLVDGERLSGSRTSLLTLSDLRSADLGNYSVVVENALGRRHSASVSVETSSIELMIQKQGTAVVLSWSPAGQGAMLQTSGSLAPPEWRDVEGSESVTRMVLPLPPHASAFFRLMGDDLNFNQSTSIKSTLVPPSAATIPTPSPLRP